MNKAKLKEIAKVITKGTTPSSVGKEFQNTGIKFIKSESIGDSKFLNKSLFAFIDEETDEKLKRSRLKEDDLLFSIAGAYLGKIAIVQSDDIPSNTNQAVGIVRIDKTKADINYLYYFFSQKHINEYINQLSSQSSQPNLNLDLLGNLEYDNKPLSTQQKIASVLSALDDKIELNNRINTELEAMAKTIYDYWFVQFDFPDANSKPYKSSGGKMVYNDVLKREVPEGWEVKSLFDVADVQYGFPFSTDFFYEDKIGFPVIRIRDILENSVSNYSTQKDIDLKYKLETGDLLIGMDGNFHINYWSKEECYLNQRIVRIRKKYISNICIRYQVEPYIQLREKSVSRTTVGHLSDKDLKAIRILVPTKELNNLMNPLFDNCLRQIITNQKQNQQLSQLRDWLLPMLMNGQVSVADAYEQAAQALSMAAEDAAGYGKKK